MKNEEIPKKLRLARGFLGIGMTTVILCSVVYSTAIMPGNRAQVDGFLNTSGSQILTGDGERLYPYESSYENTDELVEAHIEFGERAGAEGCVLLKNDHHALPMEPDEVEGVTLFGMRSHMPQYAGDVGATTNPEQCIGLEEALEDSGISVNPKMVDFYNQREETYRPGGANKSTDTVNEVPISEYTMDESMYEGYNDAAVLMFGRIYSEMKDYLPGEEGIADTEEFSGSSTGNILGLSDDEAKLLEYVTELKERGVFSKVIVLINAASAMEIEPIVQNSGVDAILSVGLPGTYGLRGVASVLNGTVSPSGRTVYTYAADTAMSAAAQNYGDYKYKNRRDISMSDEFNGNTYLVEAEGIYTGYLYYETRYADSVMGRGNADSGKGSSVAGEGWSYENEVSYPFGYGLSYTTFDEELLSVDLDWEKGEGTAKVRVTNTGDTAAKCSVPLYVSVPYENGQVEKPAIQLVAYQKTGDAQETEENRGNSLSDAIYLEPGGTETLEIPFSAYDFASWDSSLEHDGVTGGYVWDQGDYYFSVGDSAHDALNSVLAKQGYETENASDAGPTHAVGINLDEKRTWTKESGNLIQNQLENMDINYWIENTVTYLSRSDWDATFPAEITEITATEDMIYYLQNNTYEIKEGESTEYTFSQSGETKAVDMIGVTDYDDPVFDRLLEQLSLEWMVNEIANGGTSVGANETISLPEFFEADGPGGLTHTLASNTERERRVEGNKYTVELDDKNADYWLNVLPTASLLASSYSHRLAGLDGELAGNDTIWTGSTFWFAPALNLHRTPYNARNNEYYSEDAVLSGGMSADVIAGSQEYGAAATPKHFAFNDQETNRTGVSVFMTEQKAREGELKAFRKAVVEGGARCLMESYNRAGVIFTGAHEGLINGIVRNEWGFQGMITSDMVSNAKYQTAKESLMAGTNWMLQNSVVNTDGGEWYYMQEKYISGDAQMTEAVRESFHRILYSIANTNVFNGWTSESTSVRTFAWWEIVLIAGIVVSVLLSVVCCAGIIWYEGNGRKKDE